MAIVLTERKFLSDVELDQFRRLVDRHKGDRDSMALRLMMFTGCRGVELRKIRKVDLSENGVFITAAKGSRDRFLPLEKKFVKELLEYAKDMAVHTKLFNIAERTLRYIWAKRRPNKEKGIHCLRHTFGIKFYINCENLKALQTALGHVCIDNTMVYLDFVVSYLKIRKLSKGMWSRKLKDVA